MPEEKMAMNEALDRVAKLIWMFDNQDTEWKMLARDIDALELVWNVANYYEGNAAVMVDRERRSGA